MIDRQVAADLKDQMRQRLDPEQDLRLVDDQPVLSADQLVEEQVAEAIALGQRDYRHSLKWKWPSLHDLVGPILPGELWTIGARPGQGKTTLLMNWIEHLVFSGKAFLFIGLEMSAAQLRRKWAAWRCGFDIEAVLTNNWKALPIGARETIEADLEEQAREPLRSLAHFAPARRIDVRGLRNWVQFAQLHGCSVAIVDHFHRLDFGGGSRDQLQQMSETVRTAKELAITLDIALVMAAQLNRGPRDVLDPYHPPPLSALKSCGTIEEESDVVLMLHRALRRGTKKADTAMVREGLKSIHEIALDNTMSVCCRKHRRNGAVSDRNILLGVDGATLIDRKGLWEVEGVA